MKKVYLTLLILGMVSVGHAVVVGDFEGTLDGWYANGSATFSTGTTGATLNSQALQVAPVTGFSWEIRTDDSAKAAALGGTSGWKLILDVTFITNEWSTTGDPTSVYVGLSQIAVQGGSSTGDLGWTEFLASADTGNPGYPGFWSPVVDWYGESQTRTIEYDLSVDKNGNAVDLGAVFGGDIYWFQFYIATNIGSNDGGTVTPGNYYIDNIRFESVPEPVTLALLGLGGLAALRRRK